MSTSRNTGLLRLRHLREVNEATAEDMDNRRERFAALADPSAAPRVVSSFNLFQTPGPIADRMAAMAKLDDAGMILEPSAGLGRLYRAIRYRSCASITLVENSPACCAELYREMDGDAKTRLVQDDFLTWGVGNKYDRIIMNPPFKMGSDIKHIMHAVKLLGRGGILVALCYNGSRQNAQLKPIADSWEVLPGCSFKSEGTRADVALMTIHSPSVHIVSGS